MNEDDGDDHSITKAEGNYDLSVLSWLDRAMTSVLVMTSVSVYLVLKGGNEGWKGKTETLIQSEREPESGNERLFHRGWKTKPN